jgi:hypothetical protein
MRPSVVKLLFILPASAARLPVAPERSIFSLPAKSTKGCFNQNCK